MSASALPDENTTTKVANLTEHAEEWVEVEDEMAKDEMETKENAEDGLWRKGGSMTETLHTKCRPRDIP